MSRLKPDPLTTDQLAELCLGFLAENPDELGAFMADSGYSVDGLRGAVGSPVLARGLIDYFAQREDLLLSVCANNGITPEAFMRVWARLNPAG